MGLSSIQDARTRSFWTAALAELLGTMFLVLIACGACADMKDGGSLTSYYRTLYALQAAFYSGGDNRVRVALAFGLSVATIVWVIARVSGGHINPAVTFGFLITRRITVLRALVYIMSQCFGALIGAFLLQIVTPTGNNDALGHCSAQNGTTITQVFLIELMITFVLVWTVFGTCDPLRRDLSGSGPLAIGLSISMCHLWAVPFTGSGMNPARVMGSAIVSRQIDASHWARGYVLGLFVSRDFDANQWAYWAGPFAGAMAAALLYEFVMAVNSTTDKLKGFMSKGYDNSAYDDQGRKRTVSEEECVQLKGVKARA